MEHFRFTTSLPRDLRILLSSFSRFSSCWWHRLMCSSSHSVPACVRRHLHVQELFFPTARRSINKFITNFRPKCSFDYIILKTLLYILRIFETSPEVVRVVFFWAILGRFCPLDNKSDFILFFAGLCRLCFFSASSYNNNIHTTA